MTMSSVSRRHPSGLLTRPPSGIGDRDRCSGRLLIDPIAQLAELADLLRRELLSMEEYQIMKLRIVGVDRV
jgi:hypothetical protein